MSNAVFPALVGQSIDITRSPTWPGSSVVAAVSGKETAIANQANPRWVWDIHFEMLRLGNRNNITYTELQQIAGFFNARQGVFDSFLYDERDDNTATGAVLGVGNGVALTYQLVRTFGGFAEPILAPNVVSNVYVNGIVVSNTHYTVSAWGSAAPGVITFAGGFAPANGLSVTADFTYYWPVRFTDAQLDFNRFMATLYSLKSVKMISKK